VLFTEENGHSWQYPISAPKAHQPSAENNECRMKKFGLMEHIEGKHQQ